MEGEGERHLSALAFGFDRGVELAEEAHPAFIAEAHHVAGRETLGRFDEGLPARAVEATVQRGLDGRLHAAASDPAAAQACGDHLGIVDDQRITGTQQLRKIAHAAVLEFRRRAGPHHQQPRGIARGHRTQCDPRRRQLEVEQVRSHAPSYKGMATTSWTSEYCERTSAKRERPETRL